MIDDVPAKFESGENRTWSLLSSKNAVAVVTDGIASQRESLTLKYCHVPFVSSVAMTAIPSVESLGSVVWPEIMSFTVMPAGLVEVSAISVKSLAPLSTGGVFTTTSVALFPTALEFERMLVTCTSNVVVTVPPAAAVVGVKMSACNSDCTVAGVPVSE